MSDRAWKAFERRLARDVGTERIPVTGERAGADLEDELFCYQAKLGRRCPAYLAEWLAGIRAAGLARQPERVGVVVWKPKRAEDRDALVILRWADWVELHGHSMAPATPPKALQATIPPRADHFTFCQRAGCGAPLPPRKRVRGDPRRFCSAHCRWLDWAATHPRRRVRLAA